MTISKAGMGLQHAAQLPVAPNNLLLNQKEYKVFISLSASMLLTNDAGTLLLNPAWDLDVFKLDKALIDPLETGIFIVINLTFIVYC